LRYLFIFFLCNLLHAQSTITGMVLDKVARPVAFANVILKLQNNPSITGYTHTDKDGNYILRTTRTGNFEISFSAMSYKTTVFPLIIDANKNYTQDCKLQEEFMVLNEVFVTSTLPIVIKKDTIIIDAKVFAKGNETLVEDLLRKIPGLNISEDGTVKVGNQEVEKIMVEGDDFFEHGYKILTKNLNAGVVDKVEIYKKYSSNRLLKEIENSDKVALNLTLKKNLKTQWFGNISLGYGVVSENRYETRTNLMSFRKKAKYYAIGNLNNTGKDAIGEVNQLIRPYQEGQVGNLGDDQSATSLLELQSDKPNLKSERINFNNAELVAINAIFKVSPKVKIKTLGFFNWDENDFYSNQSQKFKIENLTFANSEDYNLRKNKGIGFGKIDLTYDVSKTKMLEYTGKYNNANQNTNTNLVFNKESTTENLKENNELIDQKITFTNKFNSNKALVLTSRYINEKTPQNYKNNVSFFSDLLPGSSNATEVSQISENKMQFAGLEAGLLSKSKNENTLELKSGLKYRQDFLNSKLFFEEDNNAIIAPLDYLNTVKYVAGDAYLNSKYFYFLGKCAFQGSLELHQLFNKLQKNEITTNEHPFFVNPELLFVWQINDKSKISTSYSYNKTNARILDVFNNYILTGYNTFEKGTGNFKQLQASTFYLKYELGNWGDKFFAYATAFFSKNHDFYTTNTLLKPQYSQSEKIIIKGRELLSLSSNVDWFLKPISSNLKLELNYSKSNYKNIVNNTNLRQVYSESYTFNSELRSSFKGILNYHFGSKWTVSEIKTAITNRNTDTMSFLDLSFVFNKKLNAGIQTERYFFGNLDKNNNEYYFLDLNANYKVVDNKLSFTLSGQNLLDTKTFRQTFVSDIVVSTTEYRLLPRYVLLKIDYRF
jgi:CarboxypepD_reg-like domain